MRSSPVGRSRAVVVGVTRLARMPSPLLVVDAPSVLYRAFHALPSKITGAEGRPVNALLGGVNLVMREVERHEPRVAGGAGDDQVELQVELEEEILVLQEVRRGGQLALGLDRGAHRGEVLLARVNGGKLRDPRLQQAPGLEHAGDL